MHQPSAPAAAGSLLDPAKLKVIMARITHKEWGNIAQARGD